LQKGDKHADGKVHTIDTNYYQKLDPVGCIVNHLKSVRLEINIESKRSTVEDSNMLEFVYFLLANAKVLQIMKIQSAMSNNLAWITVKQNMLSQCHRASMEARVVFEGLKVVDRKGFSIEDVNALPDPFDSDIDIVGY
jgi:DNA-directed RNA polymerase specialized sigma54-like protein